MGERVQDARSQVMPDRPLLDGQSVCLEPATKWTPPRRQFNRDFGLLRQLIARFVKASTNLRALPMS